MLREHRKDRLLDMMKEAKKWVQKMTTTTRLTQFDGDSARMFPVFKVK